MRLWFSVFFLMVIILSGCNSAPRLDYDQTQKSIQKYHDQLKAFRSEFRELEQPDVRFYLFGMGTRRKLLYKNGKIKDALTGAIVEQWDIVEETIVPNAYTVLLKKSDGQSIIIFENEEAVWVQAEKTTKIEGTGVPIHLPDFEGHKYSEILKVLHQEILINVIESKPLPNYFVYKKPWRRDAAMMAMCLEKTGNTSLILEWILSIDDPYDHNNGQVEGRPEDEADNLGQTLYLISLFSNSRHAVVPKVMEEIKRFEVQDKYGIRALSVKVDVTEMESILAMKEFVNKELGVVDIIVNNAIIWHEWKTILEQDKDMIYCKRFIQPRNALYINNDNAIDGILVQLPLPKQIDEKKILNAIDPDKDVDGFHPVNVGRLMIGGDEVKFPPCTPAGIQEMIVRAGVETSGAEVVVVGRSNIVGKPIANMMVQKGPGANSTVTVVHTRTRDLASHCKRADILIVAAGVPGLVKPEWIKPGACVIDVGVNRIGEKISEKTGKKIAILSGDVDFDAAKEIAGSITPVPGGVGPMTITMLMKNTLKSLKFRQGIA